MFRITRQTDYAIRIVLALAKQPENRLTTKSIQEDMQIPRSFLLRIVAHLAQDELIQTFPGRNGGIQIKRKAEEITLRDIIESIEGTLVISECLINKDFCSLNPVYPVQKRWSRLQAMILKELDNTNFAMLAMESEEVVGRTNADN